MHIISGICEDDHDGVLATVDVSIPSKMAVRRQVYDFRSADWAKLCDRLGEVSWGGELSTRSADDAAAWFTAFVFCRDSRMRFNKVDH